MESAKRSWILGVLLVIVAAGGAYVWYSNRQQPINPSLSPFSGAVQSAAQSSLPILFESPEFSYVDQNGAPASNSALKGRVWIADFIFTRCQGSCPKVTAEFVKLQQEIEDSQIRFVSFTVDPQHDAPKVLKDYSQKNNNGDERWMLLRPPDLDSVMTVARRMSAVQHAHDAKDAILHTDFMVLIDDTGHVRGLYDSKSDVAMQRLKEDAMSLLRHLTLHRGSAVGGGQ